MADANNIADPSAALALLTDKEKETLRLIVRGHDAKSSARALGLSVHTVNERLRCARQKLSVTSSREAARRLLKSESEHPQILGDRQLGDAKSGQVADPTTQRTARHSGQRKRRRQAALLIGGFTIMITFFAWLALSSPLPADPAAIAEDRRTSQVAISDAELETAARGWLALVDASDWPASFNESGTTFRGLNTLVIWQAASEQARAPLGALVAREPLTIQHVNAPPHGYAILTFKTQFANRQNAIETVTLEREGPDWKVVGYLID